MLAAKDFHFVMRDPLILVANPEQASLKRLQKRCGDSVINW